MKPGTTLGEEVFNCFKTIGLLLLKRVIELYIKQTKTTAQLSGRNDPAYEEKGTFVFQDLCLLIGSFKLGNSLGKLSN